MNTTLQKIFLILTGACLVLAASAGWVLAQTYPAGSASIEPRVGLFGTTNNRVNTIWTYGAAAGYYVTDNVALELEGMGVYVDQTRPAFMAYGVDEVSRKAHGFGSNLNIRWHMVATTQASLFFTGGVGGLWTDTKVPYNGFESSVTENFGLGGSLALAQHISVNGTVKYLHIGQFSDQGVSGFGGTLGLNFSF